MRCALLLPCLCLLLAGCEADIVVTGFDLSRLMPEREGTYWRYSNDAATTGDPQDPSAEARWRLLGNTSPQGEAWATFRLYSSGAQAFLDDLPDNPSTWATDLYFASTPTGYFLKGWSANADGPTPELGETFFDGEGVPFAVTNILNGDERTADTEGVQWTVTYDRVDTPLEFNSQRFEDYWVVTVQSDTDDQPIDGTYWMSTGLILQYDVRAFEADGSEEDTWQHVTNAAWCDIPGAC